MQQIAMMKEELVTKEKWVSPKRFQRVFGARPSPPPRPSPACAAPEADPPL